MSVLVCELLRRIVTSVINKEVHRSQGNDLDSFMSMFNW